MTRRCNARRFGGGLRLRADAAALRIPETASDAARAAALAGARSGGGSLARAVCGICGRLCVVCGVWTRRSPPWGLVPAGCGLRRSMASTAEIREVLTWRKSRCPSAARAGRAAGGALAGAPRRCGAGAAGRAGCADRGMQSAGLRRPDEGLGDAEGCFTEAELHRPPDDRRGAAPVRCGGGARGARESAGFAASDEGAGRGAIVGVEVVELVRGGEPAPAAVRVVFSEMLGRSASCLLGRPACGACRPAASTRTRCIASAGRRLLMVGRGPVGLAIGPLCVAQRRLSIHRISTVMIPLPAW